MKNKIKIFICLFGLTAISSFGQNVDLVIDSESFLLGTISDYEERNVITNEKDYLEEYGFYEKCLVNKICSLLVGKYDDLLIKKLETTGSMKICSKKLVEKISSNYTFHKSEVTQNNESIFYGKMNEDALKTELQKISFIVGVYSRFGKDDIYTSLRDKNSGRYCIISWCQFNECKKILKELKCKQIEVKEVNDNIPSYRLVYFNPSKKLIKYIDNYAYLRNQIKEDSKKTFKELSEKYR